MRTAPAAIFFDKNDHELLDIVNDVLERGAQSRSLSTLLGEHMHPQGIKEMAAPRGLRIAYAIASLLGSFEKGTAVDRIRALRSLRDEVLLSSTGYFQKNTARVLLQIMKDLLRCGDDELRQLKLAHDFRMVSSGNPRRVRAELARYYLLEMPEEWDQYAFDHHVHDANTKGRKSPTHLVMDAWIKGIRHLTVVYYNFVTPEVVEELLEASSILDMKVQVGIEMLACFRDKYVRFTWEPHGFIDNRAFLKFLGDEAVKKLMEEGRQASNYQQNYVFETLNAFNAEHRHQLNQDLALALGPLQRSEFERFVGTGQPSILHLARFIHNTILTHIQREFPARSEGPTATPDAHIKERLRERSSQIRALSVETIIERFLLPSRNPEVHDPTHPSGDPTLPSLLRLGPRALLGKLLSLHSSSRFTLSLSNLSVQDTMELLYVCEGMISHIEVYNLKDAAHGITSNPPAARALLDGEAVALQSPEQHYSLISELQQALTDDNVISLKRVIRDIIWNYEEQRLRLKKQIELLPPEKSGKDELDREYLRMVERKGQMVDILYNLEKFHTYYKYRSLGSHIGSSSTGQAEHRHGMGLVVLDTLPARARRVVNEGIKDGTRTLIPVSALLTRNAHRRCHETSPSFGGASRPEAQPAALNSGSRRWHDWSLDGFLVHPRQPGNLVTLGGSGRNGNLDRFLSSAATPEKLGQPWKYLNTNLKNSLKVLFGFIPAFLTFSLTKDWWLLAYLGAFIWFGITGSRNIIQSVLGGGGLRRSPLLPWNSLISWSRIADSLLYTGFSVPLLDYLVKTVLLDRTLGVTTATNPVLLYAAMGLANGIYIFSHNIFRGLPRTAAVGNLFRSVLAIPLAIVLNSLFGSLITLSGGVEVAGILQKWAAIISKLASDCVAAVIEGLADRQTNIRARLLGYRLKINQLFDVFSRLDLHFPEEDVLDMLQSPKMIMETLNYEAREQEKLVIVNALDLMYFWMYQPRARKALEIIFQQMSREEWLIFYRSQLVLKRHREISQVFVDGLVGKHFSKALAFYLDRSKEYLADLKRLGLSRTWE